MFSVFCKKIFLLIFSILLCFVLACCGDKSDVNGDITGAATDAATDAGFIEESRDGSVSGDDTKAPDSPVEEPNIISYTFDSSNMRNGIVAYMRSMANIEWTPSETFSLNGDHDTWGVDLTFEKGKKYRGMPYTRAACDLEGFEKYVENGVYKGPCGSYDTMPGNNCSTSCNNSWNQYINVTTTATYTYVPGYGNESMKALGNYTYPSNNRDTYKIIAANKQDVIYDAYALCQTADAIVKWSDSRSAGHARMVAESAVVVRNAAGKINPNKSYLVIVEQTNEFTTVDGIKTSWLVDKKYTFTQLINDGYVPVTPVALANEQTFVPKVTLTDPNNSQSIVNSLLGTVNTECRLSEIEMAVFDEAGNEVRKYVAEIKSGTTKIILRNYSYNLDIASLPSGKYTYVLTVRTPQMGDAKLQELKFEK